MSPEQAVSLGFSVIPSPYVPRGIALVSQVATWPWPTPSIVMVHPLDHIAIAWPEFSERLSRSIGWIYGRAAEQLLALEYALDAAMEVRS